MSLDKVVKVLSVGEVIEDMIFNYKPKQENAYYVLNYND